MSTTENVLLFADADDRGERAFQHFVWTWEEYLRPPEAHSMGGFKACLAAAKQGPAHVAYDDAVRDITEWCTVEHDGNQYRIVTIDGDVWGYVPDTPEAAELLA